MSTHTHGLVPLSADPITYGHIDIIARASRRCQKLTVLIAHNDTKKGRYLFTREERISFCERALAHLPNVKVMASEQLLVDVILREGVDAVFRGVRNSKDAQYEEQQSKYNEMLMPGYTQMVVTLTARPEWTDVSSSAVKAFVAHHIDVSAYVPVFVKAALEERILGRCIVGVTGAIATGKTYVATQLAKRLGATHINFDQLIRDLYEEDSPGAQKVRNELAALFGTDVLKDGGRQVDRSVLKERVFAPECPRKIREQIHTLTAPHVMRLYRQALSKANRIVIVEWAQLAEMEMSAMMNHQVIVVDSPNRDQLIAQRDIDETTLRHISAHQWNAQQQASAIMHCNKRDQHGWVMRFQNHIDSHRSQRDLDQLAHQIRRQFSQTVVA